MTVVGNGTGSLVLTGTLASLNALLSGGVTYQGVQDFNGQDRLTMVTDDLGNTGSGGPLSDTDVLPIEVQAVNDARSTRCRPVCRSKRMALSPSPASA